MTTKSFQASKRNVVRGFLQGLGEAIYIFKTDPVVARNILSKWMRSNDKALLESAYKSYAPRISFPPYSELAGIQLVVDDLMNTRADAKGRKAQEFVNEDVLRELDREGFFQKLQSSR